MWSVLELGIDASLLDALFAGRKLAAAASASGLDAGDLDGEVDPAPTAPPGGRGWAASARSTGVAPSWSTGSGGMTSSGLAASSCSCWPG